ncbi:SDR family oxidoreductase [Embleya sp. NBC_00896]|uniref:SDR family oxidoreductase n=1 Tax=Embleya sp. NBC_00896 TaxID=2975961 RepID=UPI00386E3F74|nr:SDR family oxidoreductase [Embleya sp. NBC_00896]
MGKLDGRVIIISGAARGQGEAEARLFVAEGAKVVIGDVLDDAGAAVVKELGDAARYVHLDVREEAQWAEAVAVANEAFGALNGLVNNAGVLRFGAITDTSLDDYMEIVGINQVGVFLGMKAVIPSLAAAGGGTIVNTSSTNGLQGVAGMIGYTATKFAVRGMTKAAALELGRVGIRVNSIHPGGIDTPMVRPDNIEGLVSDETASAADIYANLALGRIGRADEVAKLALFLTSDDSSYSTGSEFLVDGGMMAGPNWA